jgi:hypothetical protein
MTRRGKVGRRVLKRNPTENGEPGIEKLELVEIWRLGDLEIGRLGERETWRGREVENLEKAGWRS